MKIKNLEVKNFKSCPDGTYALSQINVLLGKNGRGKSSMQMALRYLLNGVLPNNPIRHGQDHLSVSAIIDDGENTIIGRECYLSDTFQINGNDVKEKVFYQTAENMRKECMKSGIHIAAGKTSNSFFTTQDECVLWEFLTTGKVEGARIFGPKELEVDFADGSSLYIRRSLPSKCTVNGKKVSAKALDKLLEDRMQGTSKALDITTSSEVMFGMEMPDFAKYLMSIIPISMDFNKLKELSGISDEEAKVLSGLFPQAPAPISISDVNNAYKTLFEVRTDLNRQKSEWFQRSMFTGFLPLPDINSVQNELDDINRKVGAIKEQEKIWSIYKKRVSERENSLRMYQSWVTDYNNMGKVPQYDAEAVTRIQNAENITRQNIEQTVRSISSMKQACTPLKRMLANLDTKVCPLCDRLTCNTDKTSCKSDIEKNIADIEHSIREMENQHALLVQQLNKIIVQRDQVNTDINRFNEKLNLYNRIQELRRSIPEKPQEPSPIPPYEQLLVKADKCRRYIEQAAVYNECRKAYERYLQLSKQYDLYCGLVIKSEPKKGMLTNTILKFLLQPFYEHVNGFMKSVFSDTEIRFDMGDNGLEVKCRPHGRECFLPLNALSDGEKMLAVFTLMDMISSISGTRILVFDRLEVMDKEAIESLFKTILSDKVMERYDHIIMASVDHDDISAVIDTFHEAVNIIRF